jgi:protein-arginine kinase activator protein McsA
MNKTYAVPEKKVCKRCGLEKNAAEFNLHHAKIKGESKYRGECKSCQALWRKENAEQIRIRSKIYNDNHVEQRKAKKREYLSNPDNLEKSRAYAREYAKKNPHLQRERLFKQYGLTAQQYEDMLKSQNFGCAICGAKKNGRKKNFVIDHCHSSNKVRGLLCTQCNAGLGNYKDSPDLLRKAINYLTSI